MYLGDGGARGPFQRGGVGGAWMIRAGGGGGGGGAAAAVITQIRRGAATQQWQETRQADRLTKTVEDGRGLVIDLCCIASFAARVAAAQDVG